MLLGSTRIRQYKLRLLLAASYLQLRTDNSYAMTRCDADDDVGRGSLLEEEEIERGLAVCLFLHCVTLHVKR